MKRLSSYATSGLGTEQAARPKTAFTLIELLVVVAIIALLISILLPSMNRARKQAQSVACQSNAHQTVLGLRMYQDEYDGSLPQSYSPQSVYGDNVGSIWSEAAWGVPKENLWFYLLTPKYVGNPEAFVCPGDPLRALYDYEERDDTTVPACGWGMNYLMRHAGSHLMNPERYGPMWPDRTLMFVEVGPDHTDRLELLQGSIDPGGIGRPWRDGGRALWDDGARPWYTGATWLTARHLGRSTMTTLDGAVKSVRTTKALTTELKSWYRDCWGRISPTEYICAMCQATDATFGVNVHYNFADQQLWWWTGPFPEK